MKKNCIRGRGIPKLENHLFSKFFLIMKATILLTLLTTLQVSASLYSQNSKLTLDIKEKSLTEVIKTIEEKSSYRFFYSDNYIELGEKVSINVIDKDINDVLYDLLKEMALDFKILANNIIVIAPAKALQLQKITGTITDGKTGEPLPGVTVMVEGTSIGVASNMDGYYSIEVPQGGSVLVFSYIGFVTEKVNIEGRASIDVKLTPDVKNLGEVVVVGYGTQKKESVVGAIAQTTGKTLERAGGVSNVGMALTGNLPGVITISSSGLPGEEDPMIIIRAANSWNNREPLVLVDGVERPMSGVDINSVQSISVLKDASATAVFGVKGANGVILITTKRGKEGSAKIDASVSTTVKVPSKLPNKYDSYDALMARNVAIEHELGISPGSWSYIEPQAIIEKYRYPLNLEEVERYPNVDWQKELFKDYAMSYNANINITGGTNFVRYFTSADFVHEGDLFRVWDNGRNYSSGYGYII